MFNNGRHDTFSKFKSFYKTNFIDQKNRKTPQILNFDNPPTFIDQMAPDVLVQAMENH